MLTLTLNLLQSQHNDRSRQNTECPAPGWWWCKALCTARYANHSVGFPSPTHAMPPWFRRIPPSVLLVGMVGGTSGMVANMVSFSSGSTLSIRMVEDDGECLWVGKRYVRSFVSVVHERNQCSKFTPNKRSKDKE